MKHIFALFLSVISLPAATFVIVNADPAGVGFNDPASAAPVGGNNGTTLGKQRLNAFQAAADKWGATLTSSAIIRVNAVWTDLPCTADSGVLGSAGPSEIWRDFPGAPIGKHWYPKALADRLANTDLDSTTEDIDANFNVNLGKPGCLTGTFFYLGLDGKHGKDFDLVTILEHEFAHGLGFHTSTDRETGAFVDGIPNIADDFLTDTSTGRNWSSMSALERASSAMNTGHLVWTGGNVTYALPRVLQQQMGTGMAGADNLSRALLYAPSSYSAGSSVAHWDISASPNQLMEPVYNDDLSHQVAPPDDLTLPFLQDIGWISGAEQLPRLQIGISHSGSFTQRQTGTQTVLVSNTGNAPTVGATGVIVASPAGLAVTSIAGTGWNCTLGTAICSRSDVLPAGSTYPPITVAMNVAPTSPLQVTSLLGAWGGGSLPAAATDTITITAGSSGGGGDLPADAGGQKILPQLAFGGGWYTALYFTNTTASPVSFPLNFIADDGSPLTIPSVGGATSTVNLAARGTALVEALNVGALSTGYVSASLPLGVTGYGVFRQGAGSGIQEAVVPLSSSSATASTLIWDDTESVTAVAIVNPSSVSAVVSITVRDTNGSIIANSSVTLSANNKVATALRNLPNLGGMAGRRGSAEFTVSTGNVAVLGLRFAGTAFTSIPTADR